MVACGVGVVCGVVIVCGMMVACGVVVVCGLYRLFVAWGVVGWSLGGCVGGCLCFFFMMVVRAFVIYLGFL